MGRLYHSALALRVLGWVLVASLAVFAVASALGLAYERAKVLSQAQAQAHEMAVRNLPAISNALWQYDIASLQALLSGFVGSPLVVRVEVLAQGTALVDVRQSGFSDGVHRVWSLPINARDGSTPIGLLRISESYAAMQAQLKDQWLMLLATDLIKILGLALVLFTIVYRLVARHLSALAKEVASLRHDSETPHISLERKRRSVYRDEIDTLLDTINTFLVERKQAEEAQRIAACAFESQQGMVITDAQRRILRVNAAFTHITGYSAQEALGQTPKLLSSGRHDRTFYAAMEQSLKQEGNWTGEIWNRRKNGEVYPEWLSISAVKDQAQRVTHYVGIFRDVSESVQAQAQIATLAFYDTLTQLPNRRLLLDRLEQTLHASARHARANALLFVDLDNFKILNDALGHQQGDLLLIQIARRLKACLRDGDTIARLGADEFVVMLEDLSENPVEAATQAETVGTNLLKALDPAFVLDRCEHRCTASIGITLFGSEVRDGSEHPLKRAELAMFQAKAGGRNTLRFFEARMQAQVKTRAAMEADLREALAKQQLQLVYQPQVVGAGRVTGVEALLRWQHPERGTVSPSEFIPLAEETGLILPIGQWVLEQACAQLALWAKHEVLQHLTMAVNVSARQFQQDEFVARVLRTLEQTQATARRLKLELTESMLVHDVDAVIAKMGTLKAHGVGFSLDDFGTGYSSLAYLKRLPLDQLKIDQAFVRNIVTDPNDAAIAKMVVVLSQSMGLTVIAEGVELQAQADYLAQLGCHAYQGYLFSKPLPLPALEDFVLQNT